MAQEFIPVTVSPTGHATVPVTLESVGTFAFVLDTGAEGSAVYAKFATDWGFGLSNQQETLIGQTGSAQLPIVTLPQLILGGLKAEAVSAVVLPPRPDGFDLPGIVGLDVFGASLLDFNFPRLTIGLHDTGTRLPEMVGMPPLPAARTTGNLLTVNIRLNGEDAIAVIDTGARKTRINWVLGRKLGWTPDTLPAGDIIHGGTNTPLETGRAVVRQTDIGNQRLENVPVLVADLPVFEVFGVDGHPAVILGLDWLEQLRMVIDFPEQKVWFFAAE